MLQSNSRKRLLLQVACMFLLSGVCITAQAQVATTTFGKNRIQYHKFNWRFYQTDNFNVHFTQAGLELAKYVLQVAETELPDIEGFTETALQRRANIVLYNSYDDMQATNIGLGNDVQDVGGVTRLVNNKMIIYFNGNHADLRRQIREGIARILVDNRLFGENIGEIAGNATLLDLPKWLTDGYVEYAAEHWSVALDDALKNALLSGSYKNFYSFAFDRPTLAGHAFWQYIANTYKKENVTYFMYLAILYKNLNSASQRICKKKFKDVLSDFMAKESDKYYQDIRGRRNYPKGTVSLSEVVDKNTDFYHFAPNPIARSYTYAVAEYKKGFYKVCLYENFVNKQVLVKTGVRVPIHQRNPNYPVMAWDPKGTRLAVIYWEKDKVKLVVHDLLTRAKSYEQELPFEQVQDAQYYLDHKKMILSAAKNGHTDIFVYNLETQKATNVTNDVWDDLDASFVSFPNKYGIIFASNRPTGEAKSGDTTLPATKNGRYNIFLVDADDKGGFRQITQLSKLKFGDARYPTQYNMNHFTFVSDANGVGNRYAGFFTTKAEGLDTVFYVGDQILRNPEPKELDSTLRAWERPEPDSIGFIAITRDSTYTFPLTNYESSLLETRIAGEKGQVSEVTQQGDIKFLYRLRVDSIALRRRNVNPRPTDYMKNLMNEAKLAQGKATSSGTTRDTSKSSGGFFQGEFEDDKTTPAKTDNTAALLNGTDAAAADGVLAKAKLYKYKLKFSNDQILAGVANNMLINRFQPYAGGAGPIRPANGNNISWNFVASLSDVMEDHRFVGGVRPGINFRDNEYFISYQNYRRRIDYGFTFYRAAQSDIFYQLSNGAGYFGKQYTSLYQANVTYPFDVVRSLRLIAAYRLDRQILNGADSFSLRVPDSKLKYVNMRLEYVHDNVLNLAQNIFNGLRYKAYIETIAEVTKTSNKRQFTFNVGIDARYYYPIFRNLIWAVRGAGDISWGNQKLIYYLGGQDGSLNPKFNNNNRPSTTQNYVYQTLALNLRGFTQNVANGNNNVVINSEVRLPVFSTLFNRPINNAFLRNFQVVQFIDLGTAWEGKYSDIKRPQVNYTNGPVNLLIKAGGIGPFAGGYGFGVRSTLLGYIVKLDAGWPMSGFFRGKPMWHFGLGLDF